MIQVKISSTGIQMDGHAGRSVNGQDIVCSAVSALTCNLINSLEDLTDNRIRAETASGKTIIKWHDLDDRGETFSRFLVPWTYSHKSGIQLHKIYLTV